MLLWFCIFIFLGLLSGVATLRFAFTTDFRTYTVGDWIVFVLAFACGVAMSTLSFWIAFHML